MTFSGVLWRALNGRVRGQSGHILANKSGMSFLEPSEGWWGKNEVVTYLSSKSSQGLGRGKQIRISMYPVHYLLPSELSCCTRRKRRMLSKAALGEDNNNNNAHYYICLLFLCNSYFRDPLVHYFEPDKRRSVPAATASCSSQSDL